MSSKYTKHLLLFAIVLFALAIICTRKYFTCDACLETGALSKSKTALVPTSDKIAASDASHVTTKIGSVDMNRIFTEYDKTKKAQVEYQALETAANKDLDERIAILKQQMKVIAQLETDLAKPELSNEERTLKKKMYEEKVAEAQKQDRETAEFRSAKQKKFQDQFLEMRKNIVDEIMKVVDEQTKIRGFDLVLDRSGLSAGAVPVVLYARPEFDISNDVIAILNKKSATK